jgi:hypothetical protein
VGDEKREPFESGEGSGEAEDRLRERVAAARTSIGEMVREAVERLELSERAALRSAEDRLARLAAERMDDALVRLEIERGELHGDVERRLERAIERLASEVGERLGAAKVQLAELAGRRTERGVDARAERDRLERAGEDALGLILEAESRVRRLVEGAGAEVADAERRLRGVEQRAARMEVRVTEAAKTAAHAADWKVRMDAAARAEAEAARRIQDAERRLLGRTFEPGSRPGSEPLS